MKYISRLIFSFLFCSVVLQGESAQVMKNLELKVRLEQDSLEDLITKLTPYYAEVLLQKDTYFQTPEGRLKLREEKGKVSYLIRYQRPDLQDAKESNYIFYTIQDADLFLSVCAGALQKELVVEKQRTLYFPKPHIRVHLDQVEELGHFLEIEIIMSKKVSKAVAEKEMEELQEWLELTKLPKVGCGYRELLLKHRQEQSPDERDLSYYINQNKIFWVIAEDLAAGNFKRYDVVPCIFVEQFHDGSYGIIQLDPSITEDRYQYTAWRKLIGQEHGFRAEVLLIDSSQNRLYTLRGEEILFETLSRSDRLIDKSYLAPFAKIRN